MSSIQTLTDDDNHEQQWWEPSDPATINPKLLKYNELYVCFDVLIAQSQERRSSCFRVNAEKLFSSPIVVAQLLSNASIPPHYITGELNHQFFNAIPSIARTGAKFIIHLNGGEADLGDRGVCPASNSSIKKLEKVMKMEIQGLASGSGNSCSICLDELSNGLEARRMPCKHVFHWNCIVKWLKKSNVCPLCRYEMPKSNVCPSCHRPFSLVIILSIYY